MGNSDKPFSDLEAELAAIEADAAGGASTSEGSRPMDGFKDDLSDLPDTGSIAQSVDIAQESSVASSEPALDLSSDFNAIEEPAMLAPPEPDFTAPESLVAPTPSSMDSVRNFSDTVSVGGPTVPASFPFHLWLTGKLEPHEKERLLDLVEKEKFGIERDVLEMQIDAGRMLLPRISEYAAMLVVQALRSARITVRMQTSASVDASHSSDTMHGDAFSQFPSAQTEVVGADLLHPADQIPVLLDDAPEDSAAHTRVDTFLVSQVLTVKQVETKDSKEYQDLLDAMKRELKHRAFRRGVTHLYQLKIDLSPLTLPSSYRLTLQAVGVKNQSQSRRPGSSLSENGPL